MSDPPPDPEVWVTTEPVNAGHGRRHGPFSPITPGAARAFVVLSILTLMLAGAAYFFSVRAVHGEIANRATVTQLCETGNEFRAQQLTLWAHIVAVSVPPPRETPAQKQQREITVRKFLAYVKRVFAPRDCAGGFTRG